MDPFVLTLGGAYLLDLVLGDPRWFPHPVRGLGGLISRGEALLRKGVRNEVLAGALLTAAVVLGTWFSVLAALEIASAVIPKQDWIVEMLFLYFCLSTKDLAVESWPVYRALRRGDLDEARRHLGMIVGRDTGRLDEKEIARATLETIAESAMDGITAPLFYAVLGGAPLCCVYKAVNTLDSMVGYRSARYIRFGKAAAGLDRWLNMVPAWLTALFIVCGGWLLGFRGEKGFKALADHRIQAENSFIPEAAMAGVLGVRLGGVNVYDGKPVTTPVMGSPLRPLRKRRIPEAIRLMYVSSVLALGGALWLRFFLVRLAR